MCVISQNCKNYSKSLLKDTVRVLAVVMSLQSKESAVPLSVKAAKSNLFDYVHGVKANVARQMFPATRLGASASKLDSVTQKKILSKARAAANVLGSAFDSTAAHIWQTIKALLARVAFR